MPHFREFIDPNFLCNLDFLSEQGQYLRKIVTIKDVTKEEVHNGKGGKEIVTTVHTFETKPFVLSKSNMKTIISITRKINTDDWKGERIELFIAENQRHFGQIFDVIKVSTAKPAPAVAPDYTKQIEALRACSTLAELQQVYMSFTPDEKAGTIKVKDELKSILK